MAAAAGPFALVTSCAAGFAAEELVKRESSPRRAAGPDGRSRGAPACPRLQASAWQLLTPSPGPQGEPRGVAVLPSRTVPRAAEHCQGGQPAPCLPPGLWRLTTWP